MLLKLIQHDCQKNITLLLKELCAIFIFTSLVEFDISIVCYLTAWNSLKHLTSKFRKKYLWKAFNTKQTKLIRMFCFWITFIIARNFKVFFIFQSYDESVLVLWKKVTILTKLSSLIILRRKSEVLKSKHYF